jgi:hypothetical protein
MLELMYSLLHWLNQWCHHYTPTDKKWVYTVVKPISQEVKIILTLHMYYMMMLFSIKNKQINKKLVWQTLNYLLTKELIFSVPQSLKGWILYFEVNLPDQVFHFPQELQENIWMIT